MHEVIDNWRRGVIGPFYFSAIQDYVWNPNNYYDDIQDWLWDGINIPDVDSNAWADVASQIIDKVVFDTIKNQLAKFDPGRVREVLHQWLDEFKE